MLGGAAGLGGGIALIAIGLLLLFIVPWVGLPLGVLGLIVVIVALVAGGRRAADPE